MDEWMDESVGVCKGVRAGLRIAYSNQKLQLYNAFVGLRPSLKTFTDRQNQ